MSGLQCADTSGKYLGSGAWARPFRGVSHGRAPARQQRPPAWTAARCRRDALLPAV